MPSPPTMSAFARHVQRTVRLQRWVTHRHPMVARLRSGPHLTHQLLGPSPHQRGMDVPRFVPATVSPGASAVVPFTPPTRESRHAPGVPGVQRFAPATVQAPLLVSAPVGTTQQGAAVHPPTLSPAPTVTAADNLIAPAPSVAIPNQEAEPARLEHASPPDVEPSVVAGVYASYAVPDAMGAEPTSYESTDAHVGDLANTSQSQTDSSTDIVPEDRDDMSFEDSTAAESQPTQGTFGTTSASDQPERSAALTETISAQDTATTSPPMSAETSRETPTAVPGQQEHITGVSAEPAVRHQATVSTIGDRGESATVRARAGVRRDPHQEPSSHGASTSTPAVDPGRWMQKESLRENLGALPTSGDVTLAPDLPDTPQHVGATATEPAAEAWSGPYASTPRPVDIVSPVSSTSEPDAAAYTASPPSPHIEPTAGVHTFSTNEEQRPDDQPLSGNIESPAGVHVPSPAPVHMASPQPPDQNLSTDASAPTSARGVRPRVPQVGSSERETNDREPSPSDREITAPVSSQIVQQQASSPPVPLSLDVTEDIVANETTPRMNAASPPRSSPPLRPLDGDGTLQPAQIPLANDTVTGKELANDAGPTAQTRTPVPGGANPSQQKNVETRTERTADPPAPVLDDLPSMAVATDIPPTVSVSLATDDTAGAPDAGIHPSRFDRQAGAALDVPVTPTERSSVIDEMLNVPRTAHDGLSSQETPAMPLPDSSLEVREIRATVPFEQHSSPYDVMNDLTSQEAIRTSPLESPVPSEQGEAYQLVEHHLEDTITSKPSEFSPVDQQVPVPPESRPLHADKSVPAPELPVQPPPEASPTTTSQGGQQIVEVMRPRRPRPTTPPAARSDAVQSLIADLRGHSATRPTVGNSEPESVPSRPPVASVPTVMPAPTQSAGHTVPQADEGSPLAWATLLTRATQTPQVTTEPATVVGPEPDMHTEVPHLENIPPLPESALSAPAAHHHPPAARSAVVPRFVRPVAHTKQPSTRRFVPPDRRPLAESRGARAPSERPALQESGRVAPTERVTPRQGESASGDGAWRTSQATDRSSGSGGLPVVRARTTTPGSISPSYAASSPPLAPSAAPMTDPGTSPIDDWGGLPAPWQPLPSWMAPSQHEAAPSGSGDTPAVAAPATLATAGLVVQRAPRDEQGAGAAPASAGAAPAHPAASPQPDIDALARQVYDVLKRRLSAERRRGG